MPDLQLTLTEEERKFLQDFLTQTQKDMRVEEHRTRTPSYRQYVIHREDVVQSLLNKLGQAPG